LRARKQRVFELPPLLFRAHLRRLHRPLVHPCPRALRRPLTHFSQASRRQQRPYPRSRFGLRRSTSASRRAPALGHWVCPCPPQLLAVRLPSRVSYPHRSRRRPRIASSQPNLTYTFSCFGYLGFSTAVTTSLVACQ
jgi:hypothetical protein